MQDGEEITPKERETALQSLTTLGNDIHQYIATLPPKTDQIYQAGGEGTKATGVDPVGERQPWCPATRIQDQRRVTTK